MHGSHQYTEIVLSKPQLTIALNCLEYVFLHHTLKQRRKDNDKLEGSKISSMTPHVSI